MPHSKTTKPQFGHLSADKDLTGVTKLVQKGFVGPIHSSRSRQLLFLDIMGFLGLRTIMDLRREYIFENTYNGKRQVNWAAGMERVLMELLGSMSDGIGLLAFAAGYVLSKATPHGKFANHFTDMKTLAFFEHVIKKPEVGSMHNLTQHISELIARESKAPSKAPEIQSRISKMLKSIEAELKTAKWFQKGKVAQTEAAKAAVEIANLLKLDKFDIKLNGHGYFSLDTLLEDLHALNKHAKFPAQAWEKQTTLILEKTLRFNRFRIPLGIVAGLGLNMLAPYLIHRITKKVHGISEYPGEQGLREIKTDYKPEPEAKSKAFPYLTKAWKEGNILPFLISIVPLPLVFGLLDSDKLATEGLKAAFNKPGKGFWKRFLEMMQFGKRFPFASSNQMSMLYATVVFSRVATARNAIEFRERTVDAFLGWSIWVFAAPKLQKFLANWWDSKNLIKNVDGIKLLRSENEITHLLKNKSAWGKHIWITALSAAATIVLLGIIEPLFSIKLTEWQSKKNKSKDSAKSAQKAMLSGQQQPSTTIKGKNSTEEVGPSFQSVWGSGYYAFPQQAANPKQWGYSA